MYAESNFQLIKVVQMGDDDSAWGKRQSFIDRTSIFSSDDSTLSNNHHITAIIGKNGTGKSYLLSSIVRTFNVLDRLQKEQFKQKRSTNFRSTVRYLEYICDGQHCTFEQFTPNDFVATINGTVVTLFNLPIPRKIVALTTSPFDKFPLSASTNNFPGQLDKGLYEYLGLRDRFGKASIESLLYKSLSSLFDVSENEALRRSNIGAVFEFLDLEPRIKVVYRFKNLDRFRDALNHEKQLNLLDVVSPSQLVRLEEVIQSGVSEAQLIDLLNFAYERTQFGRLETSADFEYGGILDDFFHKLQPLRRAGFLGLTRVEVTDKAGNTLDLRGASSGTISMVSALISLASVINNGSLVLIDEPELSLHPEWQVKYIDLLLKTFGRYSGCHFVIATHSPMVISELPSNAQLISLDQETLLPAQELQGQSADFVLAEAFGLPTNGNLHIKNLIVEALRLVANGQAKSSDFEIALTELKKFEDDLEDSDPSKVIIKNLQSLAEKAGSRANL